MISYIERISELVKEIDALKPLSSSAQKVLDTKFRLEFNYNSNHLEGNTLSYNETVLLLLNNITSPNHTLSEANEMTAHNIAYSSIIERAADKERPLSESDIKELHECILIKPFWKEAITPDGSPTRRKIDVGKYKTEPNSVRLTGGELFVYSSPTNTPIEMGELMSWYYKEVEKKEMHPVTLAALFHYKFVRIHPFDDGNGRMSRLVMNYILFQNDLPPVVIKSAEKNKYLAALRAADLGDMEAFLSYIEENLIWSLELTLKAARGEEIEEKSDLGKSIAILNRKLSSQPIEVVKTPEVIMTLWEDSLKYLVYEFVDTSNKFNDLFARKTAQFGITNVRASYQLDTKHEVDLYFMSQEDDNLVLGLDLVTHFQDLKKTGFTAFFGLQIAFNESGFKIAPYRTKVLEYSYRAVLTHGEIDIIIKSLGNGFLALITENLSAAQG